MYNPSTRDILVFITGMPFLSALCVCIMATVIFKYRQKQRSCLKTVQALKAAHLDVLVRSQLEIQEQTFQNISREIHDNIGQKLTLAKLHLNTLTCKDGSNIHARVMDSVTLISEVINDLNDLSHSMSSEIVSNYGLVSAMESEIGQLKKTGLFSIHFISSGKAFFMDNSTELALFRIFQELMNNIIKHAGASAINIQLHYNYDFLCMQVQDNGKGFYNEQRHSGTGLINIKKRVTVLNGYLQVNSSPGAGTNINIEIPVYAYRSTL